jgi:hypothetical protein
LRTAPPHIDHITDLENLYTYSIAPRVLWRDRNAFSLEPVLDLRQAVAVSSLSSAVSRAQSFMAQIMNRLLEQINPKNIG